MNHRQSLHSRFISYVGRLLPKSAVPDSWLKMAEGRRLLAALLAQKRYIAFGELTSFLEPYQGVIHQYQILNMDGMLAEYARKNHLDARQLQQTLTVLEKADRLRIRHNRIFIREALTAQKAYFDHILDEIDPSIRLDEQQRRMVLNDEDYCLVIAGAGAGKTTSVAAKVKYLTEKQNVPPQEILVISYTNKAVQELRGRIQKNLKIPCFIATFHSVGNTILRRENPARMNIADPSLKYSAIMEYFQRQILRDPAMVHKLVLFFSYYLDPPPGSGPEEFFRAITLRRYETLRSQLGEIHLVIRHASSKKPVTIQNEVVRSQQEAEIANYLYLNGIDYEYEPLYPYELPGSLKPYTPDFLISQGEHVCYLEHFGLSQNGENTRYNAQELAAYRQAAAQKVRLHRAHHTDLIWTFSSWQDGRPLTEHLREELEKHGFHLTPRPENDILEKLFAQEENRAVQKLVLLIARFLTGFKTDGYVLEDFDLLKQKSTNVRTELFLDICRACYLEYERILQERSATDFEDMINDSARILRRMAQMRTEKSIPAFRYVIVDEYQDISRQRFDLVQALRDATGAKIIAVGDDWQSIYAFSGSDITLFTRFREKMGYASLLKIENTYRNSQEVIDIAGGFIKKNSGQMQKTLRSEKHLMDPVVIISFDPRVKAEATDAIRSPAKAVEHALDEIVRSHGGQEAGLSVLVLGRFGFDGYNLSRSGLFTFKDYGSRIVSEKYPGLKMTFMTAHASKGLGYDEVVLINAMDDRYGFPAQIDDDPVLSLVYRQDRSYDYAEERRLFYVAMTRTKNRVWVIAPKQAPSSFVLELLKDYKNVKLEGTLRPRPREDFSGKRCPVCGYPLKLRFKNSIGLPLYLCTNEPEVCGFMTNNLKGGTLQIRKCDCCRDGFLVVRENRRTGQMFLGCTNYRSDGRGCNRSV